MGNHFAGCGLLGIVIHFGIKSGNQQVVTYILVPKLIQLTIPQSPHPAAIRQKGGGYRDRDIPNITD